MKKISNILIFLTAYYVFLNLSVQPVLGNKHSNEKNHILTINTESVEKNNLRQPSAKNEDFVEKKSLYWSFQSVDTMKQSRDLSRNKNYKKYIPETVKQANNLNVTHIAIDTPYDEEFYPVITSWVDEARKYKLKVWFRGNLSGWEGWFGYPKLKNVDEHHILISKFILDNPDLFLEGDIFTPAPEPENGLITDPRGSVVKSKEFNNFLIKSYQNCKTAFNKISKNISCGYFSVNGDVAKEVITRDTIKKTGGIIVIDHYVNDSKKFGQDIDFLHKKLNAKIVIGEFGAPVPDIHGSQNQEEQSIFVRELLEELVKRRNYILGINYWVTHGGSTQLYNEDGTPRLVSNTLRSFYLPIRISGEIVDEDNKPLKNVKIFFPEYNILLNTNYQGKYEVYLPSGESNIEISKQGYFKIKNNIAVNSNKALEFRFTLVQDNFAQMIKFESLSKKFDENLKKFISNLR